ncbi:hypothetical protein QIS99_31060 [Streptomyces sp. B-S-A8]|uniref:Uncharacterized protein n=1 Tax=Streptomyces solicavernae TaxID=3043614 RepID=A0ABT6S1M7_9ACTN|nr:hypothetical protein [Streptomyces sp. B-S-A8]MDI3390601.1 hypothetical protein [Streptomyces sp. B-S-A8]
MTDVSHGTMHHKGRSAEVHRKEPGEFAGKGSGPGEAAEDQRTVAEQGTQRLK